MEKSSTPDGCAKMLAMQRGSQSWSWNTGFSQRVAPSGPVVTILRFAFERLRVISITRPSESSVSMVSLGLLYSPALGKIVALAYVRSQNAQPGTELFWEQSVARVA